MTEPTQTARALRTLADRYPDLAGIADERLAAAAALARIGADLRQGPGGITDDELAAALALAAAGHEGADYAELLTLNAMYARGATWDRVAAARGYAKGSAAQTRQANLARKLGVDPRELAVRATLAAHTARARELVAAATADSPVSPHQAAQAADVLAALLLAAAHDPPATGADLRAQAEDPAFAGAVDGLERAPRDQAEAAHRILADAAALTPGARADLTELLRAAIDAYDPPASH